MTWNTLLIILFTCAILLAFYFIAKKIGLIESDLSKGILRFKNKANFNFRPCFTINPVVSSDGKTCRFQLSTVIYSDKDFAITNWRLKIHKLFDGVFRQYYSDDIFGNKLPKGVIVLKSNNNHKILGLEFTPQGKYKPYKLQLGNYKAKLTASTEKGKFTYKFRFVVQEINLKDLETAEKQALQSKQAVVFQLPLLD